MSELHDHSSERYLGVELRLPLDGVSPNQMQAVLNNFIAFSGGQVVRSYAVIASSDRTLEKTGEKIDLFLPEIQTQLDMTVEDLFSENGAKPTRKRREYVNNVLRGGAKTVRDVLLSGAGYFSSVENKMMLRMGPTAMEVLRAALQEKCPHIPFQEHVMPNQMARFCRSLDEVPVSALRMWKYSDKGLQGRPLPCDIVGEGETIGGLLDTIRADEQLTLLQLFVKNSCKLEWYEQCFEQPDAPINIPLA